MIYFCHITIKKLPFNNASKHLKYTFNSSAKDKEEGLQYEG